MADPVVPLLHGGHNGIRVLTGHIGNADEYIGMQPIEERAFHGGAQAVIQSVKNGISHLVAVGIVDKVEIFHIGHEQHVIVVVIFPE